MRTNVRVFILRSEFLALLLVHVHGDGKAFPESGIADAGHFDMNFWLLMYVVVVLFVFGCGSCAQNVVCCNTDANSSSVVKVAGEMCRSYSRSKVR